MNEGCERWDIIILHTVVCVRMQSLRILIMCNEFLTYLWICFYFSTVENAIELKFKIDTIPYSEQLADPESSTFKALASSLEKKVSLGCKRKQDTMRECCQPHDHLVLTFLV